MTDERETAAVAAKTPVLIKPGSGEEQARRHMASAFQVPAAGQQSLFARLRDGLKTIQVNGETLFVAEGDTLLSEAALKAYADERELRDLLRNAQSVADGAGIGTEPLATARGLAIMTQNGKIVRWKPGTILTYRVARDTFPDQAKYDEVVRLMAKATGDWERTCGCDFRHKPDLDDRPESEGPAGAVFWVRYFDAQGAFLAAAFFPNDPRNRWHVLVDPSFFVQTTFDRTGIMRHELGHVLGFRHEHIRKGAPPACPGEPLSDVMNLSDYDPQSVMHYFCGGVGSKTLQITETDRSSAQKIYGAPLGSLAFVDEADG